MNITTGTVVSAAVHVTNEADEARVYSIEADVNVNNGSATSDNTTGQQVYNGKVTYDGVTKATFSKYSSNLSISYPNVSEEEQAEVLTAVNNFIADVKSFIVNADIKVVNEEALRMKEAIKDAMTTVDGDMVINGSLTIKGRLIVNGEIIAAGGIVSQESIKAFNTIN